MMRLIGLFLIHVALSVAYSPFLNNRNINYKTKVGGISPITQMMMQVPSEGGSTAGAVAGGTQATTSRRDMMIDTFGSLASAATAAAAATATIPFVANAADDSGNLISFTDPECNFSISVPSAWEKSVQELADRRKIVLYVDPKSQGKTLLFLAYTPVRDDFTSLSSFGSVENVAQMTVLPKGELAGLSDVEATLLSAEAKQKTYVFDYKQTVPTQPETHFRTIFSLVTGATGGAGSVLVSITAQTPEAEYDNRKSMFDEIISSYKL